MFHLKHKNLVVSHLTESLSYLTSYKDLLLNIKYSLKVLSLVKDILIFITNAAFIPIFYLSILSLIRKLWIFISILLGNLLIASYTTNNYNIITKVTDLLSNIKMYLISLSLRIHNSLLSEDQILISKKELESVFSDLGEAIGQEEATYKLETEKALELLSKAKEVDIMPKGQSTIYLEYIKDYSKDLYDSASPYLSNIDLTNTGAAMQVVVAGLLVIGSSYLVYQYGYTDYLTPSSIYSSIKKAA